MGYVIKTISRGPAGSNCYICSCGKEAFVVDPGCSASYIANYVSENGLNVRFIFLTHAHYDHSAGLDEVRKLYPDAVSYAHEYESAALQQPVLNGSVLFGTLRRIEKTDKTFFDGDKISLSEDKVGIIHTPGHTRGSICITAGDNIFTGDTLFKEGIGRSDLPGGSGRELAASLDRLMALDDGMKVYPGHGQHSTIGHEKRNNPYIRGKAW